MQIPTKIPMSLKKKMSIFFIEDNEIYSVMMDQMLREFYDFRIYCYSTAEDAIKDIYLNPDAVILDYYLPGMNGLEALKILKETKNELPVIVLSSQANMDVTLDVINAGAYEYLTKNRFTAQELNELITRIQEEKEQRTAKGSFRINLSKGIILAIVIIIMLGIVLYNF